MEYLLREILIGLLFGAPVGAIGVLTVQRVSQPATGRLSPSLEI